MKTKLLQLKIHSFRMHNFIGYDKIVDIIVIETDAKRCLRASMIFF